MGLYLVGPPNSRRLRSRLRLRRGGLNLNLNLNLNRLALGSEGRKAGVERIIRVRRHSDGEINGHTNRAASGTLWI
jgi:hypothetical protein